uniref:Uncharacterized protein n=2 Tax=Hemiselmis andersenii TaxID=464988 RepID=A0A6T8PQC2_HEMAN
MQKRKRARFSHVAGTMPGRIIAGSAASARHVIDVWEDFMLQSLNCIAGLLGKVLRWFYLAPLINGFAGGPCRLQDPPGLGLDAREVEASEAC